MKEVYFETAKLIKSANISIGSNNCYCQALDDLYDEPSYEKQSDDSRLIHKKGEIYTNHFAYDFNYDLKDNDKLYRCEKVEISDVLLFFMRKDIYIDLNTDCTLEPKFCFQIKKFNSDDNTWKIEPMSDLYLSYFDMVNDAIKLTIEKYFMP